jgi:hypothetical protein
MAKSYDLIFCLSFKLSRRTVCSCPQVLTLTPNKRAPIESLPAEKRLKSEVHVDKSDPFDSAKRVRV